ncbi:MAG TPA: extracellular solute-binding protein [Symbiobacteriaceae bacterium]|nr:extracellular solute-binding protein [Symbiobacteriaceae bacterium]
MRLVAAPFSSRTLAVSTVALSGTGLVLVAMPDQRLRLAGAILSAAGAVAVTFAVSRLRPVLAIAEPAPALSYPTVEPFAQRELLAQVKSLSQDRVIAGVAQEEVAALLKDVSTNAAELLRATTSVRSVMDQVEQSVALIETGSRDQSGRLAAAAGHSAESAESVTQIAREAAGLAASVRETAKAARSGAGLLAQAGDVVGGLGTVVSDSNAAMERLAALSSQIGKLVDDIAGVAKQSNMLALNAAIEAARAGANGRSFGVVAEAMREMANQAATASAEAARLVHQVQQETRVASESVLTGGRQVAASSRLMDRVVTDLRSILDQTAGIEGGMVSISEHAAVAEEAAKKLADQIGAVAAVSAQATAQAERMAGSSREASAAIRAISHVSRHYAKMPEQVRASLRPVERTVTGVGSLVSELEHLCPETPSGREIRYADWQPWENCRQWWHLDRFLAGHSDLTIKHLHLQNSEFDGQLALPEAPDVTWAAPDWAPQLLQPIDDLIERDGFDLSAFVPGVVDSLRKLGGGRIYGLPMHINMPLMVYNRELFDRAGVPHPKAGLTWEELIPQLERIRERTGAYGIEIDMRNNHFLPFVLHFLAPGGAALMDDAGTRIQAGAEVAEKLEFLADLGRKNLLLPYEQLWAPVRPFVKGEVAVLIGSTATLLFTPIREMAAKGELSFTPEVTAHPTFRAHRNVTAATNFHVIGIHRFARNRDASWELLKHLVTDKERIRGDILRWGQAPVQWDDGVRAAYAELGRQGAPTRYHEIWSVKTAPMPQYILTPGFRRLETVAGHEMALLMAGQKHPSDLIRSLQAAMERK